VRSRASHRGQLAWQQADTGRLRLLPRVPRDPLPTPDGALGGQLKKLVRVARNPPSDAPVFDLVEASKTREHPGVLECSRRLWKIFQKLVGNKSIGSIPPWYPGLHGVPGSFLRKKLSRSDEKKQGLSLLVRMNYYMDFPHTLGLGPGTRTLCEFISTRSVRTLPFICRVLGPIYSDGAYRELIPGGGMNTSYSLSNNYNWRRALACTMRNFVHLVLGVKTQQS